MVKLTLKFILQKISQSFLKISKSLKENQAQKHQNLCSPLLDHQFKSLSPGNQTHQGNQNQSQIQPQPKKEKKKKIWSKSIYSYYFLLCLIKNIKNCPFFLPP